MSGRKMPNCPATASKGFSSTPVKTNPAKDNRTSRGLEDGVLSEEDDTFSLLSPIYHDSFESDEELEHSPMLKTSPSDNSQRSISPVRCELPRTLSEKMLRMAVESASSPSLSAWEMWLVNKAKEERLKLEKKAEEEELLKEKQEEQEREREKKRLVMEERIHEWLKMKQEQEKKEQVLKQLKEEEEIQRQQEKQREIERKAQQKYNDWLVKKNQGKKESEKKEKEDAALKQEQGRERRRMAEEKFKEWLKKADEKSRASPESSHNFRGPYDKFLPSPSFYNPIPWKPIHSPPSETPVKKSTEKKNSKQRKSTQRERDRWGAAQLRQRR